MFHNNEILIQELKKHCAVDEIIINWKRLPRWFWIALLSALFIVLKLCTREFQFPMLLVGCVIVFLAHVVERRFLIEVKKVA